MQRYDSYKDSGIQWLGEIPSHWEIYKIRYNYYLKGRIGWQGLKSNEFCDVGPYLVTGTDFERGRIVWERCYHISQKRYDEAPEIHVMEGDLLMTKDGTVGKTAYVDSKPPQVSLNSHLLIVRPLYKGKCDNKFLQYVIYSNIFVDFYKIYSSGSIMESISQDKFCDFRFPLPHIEEQQAIASYLDTATAKIDEAIAQQQKMIDLLNERKQIIINNAVTKGLNPNAKMKPSGIDWIGNIPEHWICSSFRNIIDILTDYTANGSFGDLAKNVHYQSEGYARLVRLTDLRENLENDNGVWVDKHGYEYLSKSTLHGGELLMANVGAYSGLPCIMPNVNYLTTLAPNMFLIKQKQEKADTKFLYYLLSSHSYFNWLQCIALASAQPKLNKENIRSLQILLPPLKEQLSIVSFVEGSILPIKQAVTNATKQIALLQERKQIIINDVVTGKVLI